MAEACNHYSVMRNGEIACRDCHMVFRIDCAGSRWVQPIDVLEELRKSMTPGEFKRQYEQEWPEPTVADCPKGSCQRHGQCMYLNHPRCPLRE